MTAEPYVPVPAPEPEPPNVVGQYCPRCGRVTPCAWHPKEQLPCS